MIPTPYYWNGRSSLLLVSSLSFLSSSFWSSYFSGSSSSYLRPSSNGSLIDILDADLLLPLFRPNAEVIARFMVWFLLCLICFVFLKASRTVRKLLSSSSLTISSTRCFFLSFLPFLVEPNLLSSSSSLISVSWRASSVAWFFKPGAM